MLGSQAQTSTTQRVTTPAIQVTTPVQSGIGQRDDAKNKTPWGLISLLGLYLVWAFVEQHQKLQDSVKPSNIALNLRNLAAVILTVILGMNLLKVFVAKLVMWKIPGAETLSHLVGNA